MPKRKHSRNNNSNGITPPENQLFNPCTLYDICNQLRGKDCISEILSVGQWIKVKETKGHAKWNRFVVLDNGKIISCSITFSTTPGDKRAVHKQRSNLLSPDYHIRTSPSAGNKSIQFIINSDWVKKHLSI